MAVTALTARFVLLAPFVAATVLPDRWCRCRSPPGTDHTGGGCNYWAAVVVKLAWDNSPGSVTPSTATMAGMVEEWRGALDIIKGIITGDSELIQKGSETLMQGIGKATSAGFRFDQV